MTPAFKKFLVIISILVIALLAGVLVNKSSIGSRYDKNAPCVLDCGFTPDDFVDKVQHKGFPLSYQDIVYYRPDLQTQSPLTLESDSKKLDINYAIFIGVAEIITVSSILLWSHKRKYS